MVNALIPLETRTVTPETNIVLGVALPDGCYAVSFPLHALTGTLHVMVENENASEPVDVTVENFGTRYTSVDKIVTLNITRPGKIYLLASAEQDVHLTFWTARKF